MKKLILTSLLAISGTMAMNAQNIGFRAGADFTTATVNSDVTDKVTASETGFYIGAFTSFDIQDKLSAQVGVDYVAVKDLNQIKVPLLAKYAVSDKFNVLAGPTLGFILEEKNDVTKNFNLGLDLGATYDVTDNLFLEARYNLGLSNLLETTAAGATYKLSGFQVGLGYKLN